MKETASPDHQRVEGARREERVGHCDENESVCHGRRSTHKAEKEILSLLNIRLPSFSFFFVFSSLLSPTEKSTLFLSTATPNLVNVSDNLSSAGAQTTSRPMGPRWGGALHRYLKSVCACVVKSRAKKSYF